MLMEGGIFCKASSLPLRRMKVRLTNSVMERSSGKELGKQTERTKRQSSELVYSWSLSRPQADNGSQKGKEPI